MCVYVLLFVYASGLMSTLCEILCTKVMYKSPLFLCRNLYFVYKCHGLCTKCNILCTKLVYKIRFLCTESVFCVQKKNFLYKFEISCTKKNIPPKTSIFITVQKLIDRFGCLCIFWKVGLRPFLACLVMLMSLYRSRVC